MTGRPLSRRSVIAGLAAAICVGCMESAPTATVQDVEIISEPTPTAASELDLFGTKINLGKVSDIKQSISQNSGFFYKKEGRMWLTEYPAEALERARAIYSEPELVGMEAGVIALYEVCTNYGCRVPSCADSQWFECPCGGSFYNQAGEVQSGRAPRGMDRFPMELNDQNELIVDTGVIIEGPPIGTNTTLQEQGIQCIGFSDS